MTHDELRQLTVDDLVRYIDVDSAGAGTRTDHSVDGAVVTVVTDLSCTMRWEDGGNSTLYYRDLHDTRVAKIVRRPA